MTSVARHDSGDYSDASPQENDNDLSGNDVGGQNESDYESAGSESGRSEGDPDESQERRVDDDEDRSNPQYIPKRGTFYEHDDRTAANGEESLDASTESTTEKNEGSETPSERRRPPRKSEANNKWSHDKFIEKEQVPKSRDELVAIYGYDIRNEDAPPHARRNRRYGRGPNKYTRTWEDEEAYKRQAAAQQQTRKPPTSEDFPELDANKKQIRKRVPRPRSKSQPSSNDSVDSSSLRRNQSMKKPSPRQNPNRDRVVKRDSRDNRDNREIRDNRDNREIRDNRDNREIRDNRDNRENRDNRDSRDSREFRENREVKINKDDRKLPAIENLTISATVFGNNNQAPQRKVSANVAQQRPVPTQQAKKPPQSQPPPQQPPPKASQQQQPQPKQQQQSQQPSQQPNQPEARASKRYSSLRQRPLDTYQQHVGYNAEYPPNSTQSQGNAGHGHPQQLLQQVQQMHRTAANQSHGPSPPHQQMPQQQMPQQKMPQQQMPQQQMPQQQMPQQQIPQQQIQQQQLQQQQLQQQQLAQQQIQQQQIQQQQLQQLPQQQIPQQQMPQTQIAQQQVRLGMMEQQQLVSHPHHNMHNLPQQHSIGQMQSAQAYAPPAMMPAQYMQPQATPTFTPAPIYAQPPPAPYAHPQMYNPHHNYAGGVTYYAGIAVEPETPRAQRRPTAAIPIVKPNVDQNRPASSTEKDNIDRIVENMFVRKPWPGPGNPDASKDKERSQEPTSKESSQPNSLTSSISIDSNKLIEPTEIEPKNEPKIDKTEVVIPETPTEPKIEAEITIEKSKDVESVSIDA